MKTIKNVQTLLLVIFEHKELIIQIIAILSAVFVVINCIIKRKNNSKRINDKSNPKKPIRD